jgi:hypothetical protein
MRTRQILTLTLLCVVTPGAAQIIPKNATEPVEVHQASGEFAKKLNGIVMPTGKGWKAAMDPARRLQLMVPDKWKVTTSPEAEAVITAEVPAATKDTTVQLTVSLFAPRDADPFEIDEAFAVNYVKEVANDPQARRLKFQPTDSGHVLMRGLKFALAGGTMTLEKRGAGKGKPKVTQTIAQQQLVYIGEDRLVVVQFTAPAEDFNRYAEDLAKVFASYQNLGVPKVE